jgi:hypothetical protein
VARPAAIERDAVVQVSLAACRGKGESCSHFRVSLKVMLDLRERISRIQ